MDDRGRYLKLPSVSSDEAPAPAAASALTASDVQARGGHMAEDLAEAFGRLEREYMEPKLDRALTFFTGSRKVKALWDEVHPNNPAHLTRPIPASIPEEIGLDKAGDSL
jgi:hypothetical protein